MSIASGLRKHVDLRLVHSQAAAIPPTASNEEHARILVELHGEVCRYIEAAMEDGLIGCLQDLGALGEQLGPVVEELDGGWPGVGALLAEACRAAEAGDMEAVERVAKGLRRLAS